MKAMVLAAGVGSRLDPLTSQLPKPMVPVANRPVMEHILELLKGHGINQVVSNLHYLPEKIQQHFGDGSSFDIDLALRYEPELSGDAGGVRACQSFFGSETFVVLMGDLLTDADLSRIIAEHKRSGALATIGIKEVDDVSQYGVVVKNSAGLITGFQEKPSAKEALSNFASTGIYVLEPEIFRYMPNSGSYGFGKQLFPHLVQQNLPVLGVDVAAYWSDVGTIAQYRQSNFDALEGRLKVGHPYSKSAMGFIGNNTFISPLARIEGALMLGNNSKIGSGTVIKGRVIIGDDCIVDNSTYLEDTIVWSGTIIEPNAHLNSCIVGSNCRVSNGAKHSEVATVKWPPNLVAR